MKFKDFQAPVLFSSTFKDAWEPCLLQARINESNTTQLSASQVLDYRRVICNLSVRAKFLVKSAAVASRRAATDGRLEICRVAEGGWM